MEQEKFNFLGLNGKNIWVFGGAGLLGQATVKMLSATGAKVLCVDLNDRAQKFVESLGLKGNVTPVTFDVGDCGSIKQFVQEQSDKYGIPDGMVNLTFASTAKKMEDLSEADFDAVNHVGLTATFMLSREIGLKMIESGGGSIVLFSSMYGVVSPYPEVYKAPMTKNPVEYGVNKAGIIQMMRYLAVTWGKEKVRCNCVCPGPFPAPAVHQANPDFIERLARRSPMGRTGNPEEIASAVTFLLSKASSYITGHNLNVDGGWTAW